MMARALIALLLLAPCVARAALPPVTDAEALEFHASGHCSMMDPGTGIQSRADGRGWILSSLPGKHRIYAIGGTVVLQAGGDSLDMDVGRPYKITVTPATAQVQWCPQFAPQGRDSCGPVPQSFLYPAVTVKGR
jgi:hypothetical protein